MIEVSGKARRMTSVSVLCVAMLLAPALGASAANSGSAAGHTPAEIHAQKNSRPGAFAEYRELGLRHNLGHHDRHHAVRNYLPT